MSPTSPPLIASAGSLETAASLKDELGDGALDAAKAALEAAGGTGSEELIDLWAEVCAVLATDQLLAADLSAPSRHA